MTLMAAQHPTTRVGRAGECADGCRHDPRRPTAATTTTDTHPDERLHVAADPTTPDDELAALAGVGQLIRRTRDDHGFTLEQLALRAGVSPGLLSQMERGIGNPSFRTLHKVAGALGLRVADLMTEVDGERRILVRADERRILEVGSLSYELLTPDLRGKLEVLVTTLPPGFTNVEHPFSHEGEECVVVLVGHVRVTVGDDTFELRDGDAVTYDPSISHWWDNCGTVPAQVLGVVTPPSF